MDVFIDHLDMIRDNVPNKDLKIPYVCCYFHVFNQVS